MDRREALEIITGGVGAKAARERGESVEASSLEDSVNPDAIAVLMSAVLADKGRQTEERRKAEEAAKRAEETAKALNLEVEKKAVKPEVDRHKRHVESQQHIDDFVSKLLKTKDA